MDNILALGHFCETHGPCVVLCTQKYNEEPEQSPHSLSVPWCETCQSLQVDQALVSREESCCYVTTRTPLQQDLAFLLKHATVRSLSCEVEGTLYFGDNERGHVLSHSFTVHDSLARGFLRKYTILMLMKDKIHLLNMWPLLMKHIKEIAAEIKGYSAKVNDEEQAQRPQRAVREAQGSPGSAGRSLSQLTGKPAIYAHIHLWFSWLLGCQIAKTKCFTNCTLPDPKPSSFLRVLYQDMGRDLFRKICCLLITGVTIKSDDCNLQSALHSILPDQSWVFKLDETHCCNVFKGESDKWQIMTNVPTPTLLPSFYKEVESALEDNRLTESALEPQLTSVIMKWLHVAKILSWCPQVDLKLVHNLNVQKCDVPMLIFWTSFCIDSSEKHKSLVKVLNTIYLNT